MTIAARVHPLYGLLVSDNGGRSWTDTDGVERFSIGDRADPVECDECAELEIQLGNVQEDLTSSANAEAGLHAELKDARERIAELESQLEEREAS